MISHRLFLVVAFSSLGWVGTSLAQTVRLPQPDKDGWIKLFRGDNRSDFFISYNHSGKPPAQDTGKFTDNTFKNPQGDTIEVTGSPSGQIYFKQSFSRYRVSYQMRFPADTSGRIQIGNCGMLLHVQANDPPTNGFPRSVESQGDPTQGMGQLWPIGDIWVKVRVARGGAVRYDPNGVDTVYGGREWGSRVIQSKDGWGKPDYGILAARTGWVTQEAAVYGNDSIIHIVSDTVRMKYREPRVSTNCYLDDRGTRVCDPPGANSRRLSSGLIAWQSEGRRVQYREMKIRLLPGDPLYVPVYAEFNARNTIRPLNSSRAVLFSDGTLGIRGTTTSDGRLYVDARGRLKAGFEMTIMPEKGIKDRLHRP